ncbi:MAG: alpha-amylase family glycosyl hydrolase [Saprospiraceae bacterium]
MKQFTRRLLFYILLLTQLQISAQDFMLQGWYWDYPKTDAGYNWADTISNKATDLADAGFTYVWLPPLCRASFGNGSNGYDPKDIYDLGIDALGPTGFGTRSQLDALISAFSNNGVNTVADVVYNHRDGGDPEDNPAVEGWIENYTCTKVDNGDQPFPSDRFRLYLPIGGGTGNGAGTYYFKIRSASQHPNFYNKPYNLYMSTNTVGFQNLPAQSEDESNGGNGGGDCGQSNNTITLGVDYTATIDDINNCNGFCGIDEFALTLSASDFDAAGDTIWISLRNTAGYADQYIAGLWNGTADVQNQIGYQTFTDFTNMPSGRGGMDYTDFRPNGNPTGLNGDWDQMFFFYDYDQRDNQSTKDSLNVWTKWLWDQVGIRGFRMDAVKHFNPTFTGDLMDYLHDNGIDPGMMVGEFFDTNAGVLNNWVTDVEAAMDADTKDAINLRVFDFALRQSLKDACDAFGYDVRNIFQSGLVDDPSVGANSYNVATFLNNHDYRDEGQPVQNDPMLGYAYLLTNNQVGLPTVFYPDYYPVTPIHYPETYLKDEIDELIQVHKDYIFESTNVDYLSRFSTPYSFNYISNPAHASTTLLYQLSGGVGEKEVIVAINFAGETLKVDHQINTGGLILGDTLFDVLGNSNFPYAILDGSGQMYIELPPRSYSVWVNETQVPLPVELVEFSAKARNEKVLLEWETASEIDFNLFELERSIDGRTFEKISSIPSKGKSGTGAIYR